MTALELAEYLCWLMRSTRGDDYQLIGLDSDEPGVAVVTRGGDKFFVRVEVAE